MSEPNDFDHLEEPPFRALIPRTFVNRDSTVLVLLWPNGNVDVATRPARAYTWGLPVRCEEQDQ